MSTHFKLLVPIAITTSLLIGCVSDDETETSANASGGSATNTGGNSGSSSGSSGSFFNANDKLNFANRLGGSLTKMFNVANDAGSSSIEGYREDSLYSTRAAQRDTQACEQGTLETDVNTEDGTDVPTSFGLAFNNCLTDGSLSNGSIILTLSGNEQDMQMSMQFNNFSTTEGSETSSIDGSINISGSQSGDITTFSVSGPSLVMVSGGDTLQFSNYSLTGSENDSTQTSSMGASANISSSTDGNMTLTIDPPFVSQGSNNGYPASGRMTMVHNDGSQLEIQADNGNPSSFDYVINDNGTVTSGTELWDNTDLIF